MSLFRFVGQAETRPALRGHGVMLRPPRMDDFEEWAFLRSTILRHYDAAHRRGATVQLLFAAVFALSANLLQLLLCEILGMMDPE